MLGPAQLQVGETWTELPLGKTSALLYYLACKRKWVSRDEIVYLLWPDSPEGSAKKNLRQLLTTLRRSSYAEGLEIEENRLRWPIESDVQGFKQAISDGNLATAAQLYEGELLQGYTPPNLPEFEEWLEGERRELQESWRSTALAFAAELGATARHLQAADLLGRVRKLDILDEELLQRYLQSLALAGEKDKALEAFDSFSRALANEYGGEPEEASLHLVERIRRGDVLRPEPPKSSIGKKSSSPKYNLPLQPTPFIGREVDKNSVGELLKDPSRRLITLIGPGGIGKTRLALEVASAQVEAFKDGVWFVNLAPLRSSELLITAIADAVGFAFYGVTEPKAQLFNFLQDKQVLLVLDNFEQLFTAAPAVAELLASSSRSKALVTSRAALRIYGEQEYTVPAMALPDPAEILSPTTLSECEAVQLFVQRALAVKPQFVVTSETAPAVADICFRLDGLPLAIELAAARLRLFSPQALASRLSSRLTLLTGGAQDLPTRQQTLRGAIDWSYSLLDPDEQRLFSRLAVFVGGRSLEAVEAVCNAESDQNVDVLAGLDSLVGKSLLRQEEVPGEPRFTMLETIHEFAAERLDASGDADRVRRNHARYYLRLVEEAEQELTGSNQVVWLERLELEHDNLRAALSWAQVSEEAEVMLRLSGALWRFWAARGYISQGLERLTLALGQPTADRKTRAYAKALLGAGSLACLQGDYRGAKDFFTKSLEIAENLKDKQSTATAFNSLGMVAGHEGDHSAARLLFEDSLALKRELGDIWGITAALNNLGVLAYEGGDYARARSLYEESLALEQGLGDKRGIALSLSNLGIVALYGGDYHAACAFYKEGLALGWELGDKWDIAGSLEELAVVVGKLDQAEQAAQLFGAAAAARDAIGTPQPPSERARLGAEQVAVNAQLGEASFDTSWKKGWAMTFEQAIAFALLIEPT